jgi:hypothetical protein
MSKSGKGSKREASVAATTEVEKRQKTHGGVPHPTQGALVPKSSGTVAKTTSATEDEDTDNEGAMQLVEVDFMAKDATSVIAKLTNTKPKAPPYRTAAAFELVTTDQALAAMKLKSTFIGKKTPGAAEGSSFKDFIFDFIKAVRVCVRVCIRTNLPTG